MKRTVQLKNIYEYQKRISALAEAFAIDKSKTAGNRILVFDDLSPDGASVPKDARAATSLPGQRKKRSDPEKVLALFEFSQAWEFRASKRAIAAPEIRYFLKRRLMTMGPWHMYGMPPLGPGDRE